MQAVASTTQTPSDWECLKAWRRTRSAENLRPIFERYGALVYSSALRRMSNAEQAPEVTRAVFLVLARRARKLGKRIALADWLFQVTRVACRKLRQRQLGRFQRLRYWFAAKPQPPLLADATLWMRIAPHIDRALEKLPTKQRRAVLHRAFLTNDVNATAANLRTKSHRVEQRTSRGIKKLGRRLRKWSGPLDPQILMSMCARDGCAARVPENLAAEILQSMEASRGKRPAFKLARRTLSAMFWTRWRRRFVIGIPTFCLVMILLGLLGYYVSSLSGHSRFYSIAIRWWMRIGLKEVAEPARPWSGPKDVEPLNASNVKGAQDLFQTTNIWLAHLSFTREQWNALDPKGIGPMPNFARDDGMWLLRNPKARRSGLIGVLGYEFDWVHADFEIGGRSFTNVATRVKGNVGGLYEPKRPFKVDLNKFAKGQKLANLDGMSFNNLCWDYSNMSDALAYEFFRDAGVPASRTAYAWLSASVSGQWTRKPMGLYLMLEPVDEEFARERFGSKAVPIFKPVTYNLFEYLGDDWRAYAAIYDLKTKATPEQQKHVMAFANLVSEATDEEFGARVADYLDLEAFARFLAGQVLLSNYDGILTDGQNFYMYLDPRSNKLGFIPWDLDSSWGHFWVGKRVELERASIWHPWVGKNRFLERVMAVEAFRKIYRERMEDLSTRLFVPRRLDARIDELVSILREPIACESGFRLNKFEQAVGLKPVTPSPGEKEFGLNHPAHPIKLFIEGRAKSVRSQLDGKSQGIIPKPPS